MDTVKVGPDIIQFTAIGDGSRMRVLGIYERRTAKNAVDLSLGRTGSGDPFGMKCWVTYGPANPSCRETHQNALRQFLGR